MPQKIDLLPITKAFKTTHPLKSFKKIPKKPIKIFLYNGPTMFYLHKPELPFAS